MNDSDRLNIDLQNKFYYLFNGGTMPKYTCKKCNHEMHGWSLKEMGTVCPMCQEPVKEQEVVE